MLTSSELIPIVGQFAIKEQVLAVKPLGDGLINDTLLCSSAD